MSLKLYYHSPNESPSDNNRFVPVPLISIEPELLYANDTVVGYNYNITLNGYATALKLNSYNGEELNFTDTLSAIQHVRDVLNHNGGVLRATDDNGDIIVASGGLLQSLNFESTENNWFNYAKYTAEFSFQDVALADCDSITLIGCNVLPTGLATANSPYLSDMRYYRVKSVQDSWSIDATNIYNSESSINIQNEYIDISYNVQAVGKHFAVGTGNIPAWQQAKNYCIARLLQEVGRLQSRQFGPLTSASQAATCSTSTTANEASSTATASILYQIPAGEYTIYNEQLESTTSESEGSFSLNYKSILKRNSSTSSLFDGTHCLHRITTSRSVSDDGSQKQVTESIQGEIEGLIRGGLIASSGYLSIPNNGSLLVGTSQTETKYQNALDAYNKIINANSSVGRELKSELVVDLLNITNSSIDPKHSNPEGKPGKNSHNVVHNYNAGTISYTEDYTTESIGNASSGNTINNISISVEENIPIVAEFVIPGRSGGPIIQQFTAESPKKITISVDGVTDKGDDCCALLQEIGLSDMCLSGLTLPSGVPNTGLANYEISEDRFNINSSDGSYTINRSYIFIG